MFKGLTMLRQRNVSDTVTVTHDGRTIVDMKKLFAKQHIREMMQRMSEKTVIVPRRASKDRPRQGTTAD